MKCRPSSRLRPPRGVEWPLEDVMDRQDHVSARANRTVSDTFIDLQRDTEIDLKNVIDDPVMFALDDLSPGELVDAI